jgi:hypothetical protein
MSHRRKEEHEKRLRGAVGRQTDGEAWLCNSLQKVDMSWEEGRILKETRNRTY